MNMKQTRWFVLAGLVVASMVFAKGGPETLQGKAMPAFSMTTFSGQKITNASLKGKPYILDFWATWCGPCKAASPLMQKLHATYASKGLKVIGANMGESSGSMKEALGYPKKHKYTYTFTKGNDGLAGKIGVEGIPLFIFVDKSGKVAAVKTGYGPGADADFEATVKKLL